MPDEREKLEARFGAVALLADVEDAIAAGTTLVAELPAGSLERGRARARLESLWARVDPQAALDRLDAEPLPPALAAAEDLVRVEALLELERADEAQAILERQKSDEPRWLIARARLAHARGRRVEAMGLVTDALARPLDPEAQATALSFRFRWRALSGLLAEAAADVAALHELCDRHGALISDLLVRGIGLYAANPLRTPALKWRAAEVAARTVEELESGIEDERAKLGPMPLWVHGLFVKLREAPQRLVSIAARLAGLLFMVGRRRDAWFTLHYVDQLAARLLGEKWAAETADALGALRARIGEAEVALYEAERERLTDEHLAARRA